MSIATGARFRTETAIGPDPAMIFVSLELSRSKWLITALSPCSNKMSKYGVSGGDASALLKLLGRLRAKAEQHVGTPVKVVVIQEAGLDGFWLHRLLESHRIESHVVEPASIAVPRRHRRAKTDVIDGERLVRTLTAFKRGEPRVGSMVVAPSPEEEDRRRVSRERRTLIKKSASSTSTVSRGSSRPRGSSDASRCARTSATVSKACGRVTDGRLARG
jgi:transposase